MKKLLLLLFMAVPAEAVVTIVQPPVTGSNLPSGSTNYVQTNPVAQQTTTFNVSSGTVATQLNLKQIQWQAKTSLMLYPDGVTVLSLPTVQDTFFGYFTNLNNSGGSFNTAYGATAMPYPYTGNFNNAIGNSCMSGNLLSGENNNGMGYAALGSLRAGFYNNCMGGSSCNLITDASNNTGVGAYALQSNVTGDSNSALGLQSLKFVTGAANTGVGYLASVSTDNANASGGDDHTIFIGVQSGRDVATATTLTNAGAIGYQAYVHKSNSFQMGGQLGSGKEWEVLTTTFTVNSLQVVNLAKYNTISTVSNGVPAEYATIDTTGLTANVGASTLYAVPATGAGMYRISSYTVETTAGSISSTLPNVQIVYTDKETGGAITIDATPVLGVAGIGQTGALTANTVGTASSGIIAISVKASTTIQYQTVNYASNLAGMAYALHIKLEAL